MLASETTVSSSCVHHQVSGICCAETGPVSIKVRRSKE
jgi:hypothetical protein